MDKNTISARFVLSTHVDELYHQQHPQLIHMHDDMLELFYIMKGNGSYIVDGENYEVSHGSLVICNQSVLHGEPNNSKMQGAPLDSYCCALRDIRIPGLPMNSLTNNDCSPIVFFESDRWEIENIMTTLQELGQNKELYFETCNYLANALLNMVYIKMKNQTDEVISEEHTDVLYKTRTEFIRNVTKYLDEHYMEPVTLQELGRTFHISHYHLSHLYKQETGLSPMRYVMHRRIGEAQNMLMNSEMQVSKISARVGFEDNCYFSSTFKKQVGLTPSEYRRYFRGQNSKG